MPLPLCSPILNFIIFSYMNLGASLDQKIMSIAYLKVSEWMLEDNLKNQWFLKFQAKILDFQNRPDCSKSRKIMIFSLSESYVMNRMSYWHDFLFRIILRCYFIKLHECHHGGAKGERLDWQQKPSAESCENQFWVNFECLWAITCSPWCSPMYQKEHSPICSPISTPNNTAPPHSPFYIFEKHVFFSKWAKPASLMSLSNVSAPP